MTRSLPKTKYWLLFLLSSIPVSFIGFFVREATTTANVYAVSFYRLLVAAVALGVILPFIDKRTFRPSRKHISWYALIGFIIAINFTLFNVANALAPIANVYLLASISPAIIIVISSIYLGEKITTSKIIALLLTMAGIAVMNPLQAAHIVGNSLAILAGVTFALLFTLMKKEDMGTGAGVTFWYFAFAALFSTPLLYFGNAGVLAALPWILAFGIISTALTWLATTLLLEHESAGTTSILQTIIIPLGAVLIGFFIFSEVPQVVTLIGGVLLVLAGVVLELPALLKR